MNISTLAPIRNLPKPSEMSPLRSPRDNDSVYKQWSYIADIANNDNKIIQTVNQIIREINKWNSNFNEGFDFQPFKIYSTIPAFSPTNPSWLNVQVRGGYVFTNNFVATNSYVNGTDRMEQFSSYDILPNPSTLNTYTIPQNTPNYYFWVENSGSLTPSASIAGSSSYYLRASATPQTPDGLYNPNGWQGFPTSSSAGTYWLLGWCDSSSSAAVNKLRINQVQIGDIMPVGSNADSTIKQFLVVYETTSSLICYEQQGQTTITSGYVEVLKPLELRNIPHVYGDSSSYGLTFLAQPLIISGTASPSKRLAQLYPTASSNAQIYHQVIWPSYNDYQLSSSYSSYTGSVSASIWGALIPVVDQPPGSGSLGNVQYIDMNVDSRRWLSEIAICGGFLQLTDVTPMYSSSNAINFNIL